MKYSKNDILVCMALREEGGEALEALGANVLYTGLGKVNAAYRLTKALHERQPQLVLNMGTAGSTLYPRGALVACNQFMQRDMDVSPLGFAPYATPFENTPPVIDHRKVFDHLPHGVCGTADRFETNIHLTGGEVVDMEAYALAKICWLERVDFACVKYISDGADEDASAHWQESLLGTAQLFTTAYTHLLQYVC